MEDAAKTPDLGPLFRVCEAEWPHQGWKIEHRLTGKYSYAYLNSDIPITVAALLEEAQQHWHT